MPLKFYERVPAAQRFPRQERVAPGKFPGASRISGKGGRAWRNWASANPIALGPVDVGCGAAGCPGRGIDWEWILLEYLA